MSKYISYPRCPKCKKMLHRVYKGNHIYCAVCDYQLDRPLNSYSRDVYFQCPWCKNDEGTINAQRGDRCRRCGQIILD